MTYNEFKKYLAKIKKLNVMLHICRPEEKKHIELSLLELNSKIEKHKRLYINKDNIRELNEL